LILLAFGGLVILTSIYDDMDEHILMGAVIFTFGLGFTCRGIVLSFWKCTIEGSHISFRSLLRRREITFSDIKRVAPMGQGNAHSAARAGLNYSFIGINLYAETGKLFHIHGSKDGFGAFVARLREQNIPGAEDLPKGIRWR